MMEYHYDMHLYLANRISLHAIMMHILFPLELNRSKCMSDASTEAILSSEKKKHIQDETRGSYFAENILFS